MCRTFQFYCRVTAASEINLYKFITKILSTPAAKLTGRPFCCDTSYFRKVLRRLNKKIAKLCGGARLNCFLFTGLKNNQRRYYPFSDQEMKALTAEFKLHKVNVKDFYVTTGHRIGDLIDR